VTRLAILLLVALAAPAAAQPAPTPCVKRVRPTSAAASTAAPTPVGFSEFDIEGELQDPPATVRALFTPVMSRWPALTDAARADVLATAGKFGYFVVSLITRETAGKTRAVIKLAPLPLVRKVAIDISQSPFATLLDDQVRRRMRIRAGTYLPWTPDDRKCELDAEVAQLADYLHFDEGYFDATIAHEEDRRGDGLEITIRIKLGDEYQSGQIRVANADALQAATKIDTRTVTDQFRHDTSLFSVSDRFTRGRHLEDIQRVVDLFQRRGYPAVRVHTTFEQDPSTAFNRRTHRVDFTVAIDPRRRIDVKFEGGGDAVNDEQLIDHLTFRSAASSDDVEASNSARSIVTYLQSRGWFDAHVTWSRERNQTPPLDTITFQLELGRQRPVRSIQFTGNRVFGGDHLEDVIGTTQEKLTTSLFGGNTNATSAQLTTDIDRIAQFYRSAGYRDARVRVEAAPNPAAFGSAALTAALAATDPGDGLYVNYVIDEGEPTLLAGVEVAFHDTGSDANAAPAEAAPGAAPADPAAIRSDEQRALCQIVLADLAELYGARAIASQSEPGRCAAAVPDLKFREDDAAATRDQLKSRLYSHGRPRAEVGYEVSLREPRRVVARYTLANIQTLQIGTVVIRGNFKTRDAIILSELGLKRGALFTQEALADGARRLRNTALFDAVSVKMPDLETTRAGEVNAVVEVVERYDFLAQIDLEGGYSSYNGVFFKVIPSFKNLFGIGMSFDIAGTIGFDLTEYLRTRQTRLRQLSAEATLRAPQWLSRRFSPVEFQTELTAFHRLQDTPRFGQVTTDGATLTLSRTWERKRIGVRPARAITTGVHYDFRQRERPIDVLRPLGADDDQTQVPIQTTTGSVGVTFEWEQRVDRSGTLSPLAPESGFRFDAQASIAGPFLGGQDRFIKVSTGGTRYLALGKSLVLRADLRFDEGFPLGDAVLLPEVERFFAGGDATVRGYDDERLATEIIQVNVPPLSNVRQIRILPAGGNIRVMSSLDAQIRVWRLFATGLFVDAGMIANEWGAVTTGDIRSSIGLALVRFVTPLGVGAAEYAIPLQPQLGDDPRGRWHISFAARAQF
jgi:outer membrane protein assembly factor BamA